jgi:hypothetical protein
MAVICLTITVLAWPIGKLFFTSPNFWQMAMLAGFGLPGVLVPTMGYYHGRIASSVAAGATTFVVAWWFGAFHLVSPPYRPS